MEISGIIQITFIIMNNQCAVVKQSNSLIILNKFWSVKTVLWRVQVILNCFLIYRTTQTLVPNSKLIKDLSKLINMNLSQIRLILKFKLTLMVFMMKKQVIGLNQLSLKNKDKINKIWIVHLVPFPSISMKSWLYLKKDIFALILIR